MFSRVSINGSDKEKTTTDICVQESTVVVTRNRQKVIKEADGKMIFF